MCPKRPTGRPELDTWEALNTVLRTADSATCAALLKTELAGRRRHRFALRIYSRLNRMRAGEERLKLLVELSKRGAR